MKTAHEARVATLELVERTASEFLINEVSTAIDKKINEGTYTLRMPLRGTWGSMENYAPTIIKLLKEKGYEAELCDKSNDRHDDVVYINISWEE